MGDEIPQLILAELAGTIRRLLPEAGGAEGLGLALGAALAAERPVIQAFLAERIRRRLTAAYRKAAAKDRGRIDPAAARANCRIIAGEVLAEEAFFGKLAGWISVNVCYWLLEREPLATINGESVGTLVGVFAESAAEVLGDALLPPRQSVDRIEDILGVGRSRSPATGEMPDGMLMVLAGDHVQALRESLYKNAFRTIDGTPWPTALMGEGAGAWVAQLRPPAVDRLAGLPGGMMRNLANVMWHQQRELSDLDADVLDALCAIYLSQARGPGDSAVAEVDQLLTMRGLKRKRGGSGRRGGFEPEQRQELLRTLAHIQNLWIDMAEVVVQDPSGPHQDYTKRHQSRPFVITDRMGRVGLDGTLDCERFVFRPGRAFASFLFGAGDQTGLLFSKALQYDPYHRRWEKRLTRYLCWRWRAGFADPMPTESVKTLLGAVGRTTDHRYPAKSRARLEKALDVLKSDGVIGNWRYRDPPAGPSSGHRWVGRWMDCILDIEAPGPLKHYFLCQTGDKGTASPDASLGLRLRSLRRDRRVTQATLSAILGIAQGHLSKIEAGYSLPSEGLRKSIEDWMR